MRLNILRRDARLVLADGRPDIDGQELILNVEEIGRRLLIENSYTAASLPPAANYPYGRTYVTDATATTFASTVAGGGLNIVPVFSNGTNWIIG